MDVRRSAQRFQTRRVGIDSRHSFSFGHHYDPANLAWGPLLAHNEELLAPEAGYPDHAHADVEIVTWVLDGTLAHQDGTGRSAVAGPGTVQLVSAGRGLRHRESNASTTTPLHLVQMWLTPDEQGTLPAYRQAEVNLPSDVLVEVAGDQPTAAVRLGCRGAGLSVARLGPGSTVVLPGAPLRHVFVGRGAVTLDRQPLAAGDAARLTAGGPLPLTASAPAEVLVWAFGQRGGVGGVTDARDPASTLRRADQ